MSILSKIKQHAQALKTEVLVLYIASRHPQNALACKGACCRSCGLCIQSDRSNSRFYPCAWVFRRLNIATLGDSSGTKDDTDISTGRMPCAGSGNAKRQQACELSLWRLCDNDLDIPGNARNMVVL